MSTIRVGDLVMMVRGHECLLRIAAGVPFVVTDILVPRKGGFTCVRCGTKTPKSWPIMPGAPAHINGTDVYIALAWLRKIDPPAETEGVERGEELTA